MYRAQRVGEKTDLICLIMFTPEHVVTQLSKRAQFLYFPLLFVDFSKAYLTPFNSKVYISHHFLKEPNGIF